MTSGQSAKPEGSSSGASNPVDGRDGPWNACMYRAQCYADRQHIERLRRMREHELRYIESVLLNIRKQDGEGARESADDTLQWLRNRLAVRQPDAGTKRLPSEKLAEYRDLLRYGRFVGVGGAALASLLDEIEACWAELRDSDQRLLRSALREIAITGTPADLGNAQLRTIIGQMRQVARNALGEEGAKEAQFLGYTR